jgi:hypothetical protein
MANGIGIGASAKFFDAGQWMFNGGVLNRF